MSQAKVRRKWGLVTKLLIASMVVAVIASVTFFLIYWKNYRSRSCDMAAESDLQKLLASVERLKCEFKDANCEKSELMLDDEQIRFMVGPYYGFRGGSRKCKVRMRVHNGELHACSDKGTAPNGWNTRYIYRASANVFNSKRLPTEVGPCIGDSFDNGLCYTESIINPSKCTFRFNSAEQPDPAEVESCGKTLKRNSGERTRYQELAAKGINAFGVDLYGKLTTKDKNTFCSPYGYYAVLLKGYSCARDDTKEDFSKVMHLKDVNVPLEAAMIALTEDLNCSFLNTGGQLKITDLVGPGREQGIKFTNVVHFKHKWMAQFDKGNTEEDKFHLLDGSEVKVPMMFLRSEGFKYTEAEGFQCLELPYHGQDLSMVVFLPRTVDGLVALEKDLTIEKLAESLERLQPWGWGVTVYLPKFDMLLQYDLEKALKSLGMETAF